jgi:hypothetical protein
MTSVLEVAAGVRMLLRDFPKYFEISEGPLNVLTIRLPHPLVTPNSLQVYTVTATDPVTSALTDSWTLDERNGLLKLTDEALLQSNIVVAGYYHTWFSDADLAKAIHDTFVEVLYNTEDTLDTLSDAEIEVAQIGAVVRSLWSLSIELALDIDVSTPEGMFIPAHQRYTQVLQMMQYWENEYTTKAASLNMGLGKLEQWRLRRVSYTTGRYVPVYQDREFDDPRWPKRLYPPIPEGTTDESETPTWAKVRELEQLSGHGINYPAVTFPSFLGTGDETRIE